MILGGCASGQSATEFHQPAQTMMLGSFDLEAMTNKMAASLISSGALKPGMVIVADRVVNRTSQIIDQNEKQLFVRQLRALLIANRDLLHEGVTFVASPDELSQYTAPPPVRTAEDQKSGKPYPGPTHALTSTFLTLTHVDRSERSDFYDCTFQLEDLKTRAIVWEDTYQVKYIAPRGVQP